MKVEIKPGTYISKEGLSENQFERVLKAFELAGYTSEDTYSFIDWSYIGVDKDGYVTQWNYEYMETIGHSNFIEATYAQLVEEDNRHPQYELIEKYYREWGKWDAFNISAGGNEPTTYPVWKSCFKYELRPRKKMMKICDYEFPEPEREAPEKGTKFFVASSPYAAMLYTHYWGNNKSDFENLKFGRVHLTKEAAIAHAKAMIKASGGEVDD
jgi:hypothetical protein